MEKEQADIFRQQLEQKPPPYDDVQISSTSIHGSVTVIPPGIHGDRDVTTFKVEGTHVSTNKVEEKPQNVEETFENQNPVSHRIPTPEDNQNDIPPPVPAHVMSQNISQSTPPIPPPTTPPPPPPSHLSSSSQVSQSGTIPDIIRYSLEKRSTEEELVKPDVQISSTSVYASVTDIPPDIHGDREGTRMSIKQVERQNVEERFENQNPGIPTPENNTNDIPPPVPACVLSQNSPRRTPPIPPPTTPPPPPPSHLSSSSQVSQSGTIPDIIRYSLEKRSTEEELVKPDVQISSTSVYASVTDIPPDIHGDREGTRMSIKQVERQNVEETLENQNPGIPTPEDNQSDIPPPIPPPTTPSPPPPHLSSSSQVSQSGTIPDIIQSTDEELVQPGYTVPAPGQLPGSTERISGKLEHICPGILLSRVLLYVCIFLAH